MERLILSVEWLILSLKWSTLSIDTITRAVLVGVTNDGNVGGDGVTDTTEKDKLIVHGFHALKTRMSNAINLMVLLIELRIM